MTSEFAIAVHALVYLNHKGNIVSSEELATNVCTNPARIRKVMARLRKAGIIDTKEGLEGGYQFTGDASKMDLRRISEALEVTFVNASWKSGNVEKECMICSGMARVMDEIYSDMDEMCKEHLASISILDLEEKLFLKKQAD